MTKPTTTSYDPAPTIFITTGASGGHIFPALATAEQLTKKGLASHFILGGKQHFTHKILTDGHILHCLPALPWSGKNPFTKLMALFKLYSAYRQAKKLILKHKPAVVLGFGGYATVAVVWAAHNTGTPVVLHEQNAVPGRANKFLAPWANKIALSFEAAKGNLKQSDKDKCVLTGNPVRTDVLAAREVVKQVNDGTFHIVVQGGSLGARIISELVPKALEQLSEGFLMKLHVTHQAREENARAVRDVYRRLGLAGFEVQPFFEDMPSQIAKSHLVIGRSGAGIVSELGVLGRACILIPHKLADNHQYHNAQILAQDGASVVLDEKKITPEILAEEISDLLKNSDKRKEMEQKAQELGIPDAAEKLAKVVAGLVPVGAYTNNKGVTDDISAEKGAKMS